MASSKWPQRRIIVLLTFVCTAVCYVERTGFSIAYTAAANSAGITQKSKGNLLSAFFYGYSISQVPGGWVAQRIGGRRVLLWSFFAWTLACIATPIDPRHNSAVIILIRVLVGVAQGFIIPSVHTVLAQWVPPHERSRSVSLTTSGMYLGAAFGMLFLPELVHWSGPRAVYVMEALMGLTWAIFWHFYSTDPPLSEHPKASAAGFGAPADIELKSIHSVKAGEENGLLAAATKENWKKVGGLEISAAAAATAARSRTHIPWKKILQSLPVWAIVVNNYTFHYVLYVLMSWLPTYFDQGLHVGLQHMGASKTMPYVVMFVMSNVGGLVADYFVTRKIMNVAHTRKWINGVGFVVAAAGLGIMPKISSVQSAIVCSSVILGSLALGRAGFAVNHMDIAPRYAGIVMGISNTAGTFAGIVGVNLTGWILQSSSQGPADLGSWRLVFGLPAVLCVFSAAVFCKYASGDRVFE
ncbi:probable anion transporter 5 [Selaginella moellendorffii]|uniref:probable anion transporter 5 n=1 Tax=Selaginella moellendorffii TaxID=88036 RepID=UPI000D1C37FD|nr:probable anion transporter 5 [Selaginella moellendorffii]|eukprot:XP_024534733.1 probable anion transporter 5 [Selaginella moellendorffii]